ncbi:16S rRNA (guanine(966)-N(2))-methyltransferase RsmD [Leptolyngbyaceae cyanobacterium UHCC 1019]
MTLRIYGNRALKTLSGKDTRPTQSMVREALFNMWQGAIAQCRWLDLCAGSGAMGAEALCRGAAFVVGIEQSSRAGSVIEQNWQQVAAEGQSFQLIRGDVIKKLPTLAGQQFNLIYFDPPYASELYQPVLDAIADHNVLSANGELAVEHHPKRSNFPTPAALEICRQKTYGNTALTFYQLKS